MAKVIFKIMESKIDREGTEYRNEIMAGKRQGGIPMDREKMEGYMVVIPTRLGKKYCRSILTS